MALEMKWAQELLILMHLVEGGPLVLQVKEEGPQARLGDQW